MFGKVAVLIVCAGVCACALLAARQMRTQAAYEMTQSRLRAVRVDEDVARLRALISACVSPERVLEMAARRNPMKPLAAGPDPAPPVAAKPVPAAAPASKPPSKIAANAPRERRR